MRARIRRCLVRDSGSNAVIAWAIHKSACGDRAPRASHLKRTWFTLSLCECAPLNTQADSGLLAETGLLVQAIKYENAVRVLHGQSRHSPSCASGSFRSVRCSRIRLQSIEMAYLDRHSRRHYPTHTFADWVDATVGSLAVFCVRILALRIVRAEGRI